LLFTNLSAGQSWHKHRTRNLIFEGRVYYGWTLPHHLELQPFQAHYPAFEVSILKETYGKHKWEYMYAYPLIGISYWYSGMGNIKWIGNAHAVFPYISFPLVRNNHLSFNFRLGIGMGYLTRRYDRLSNYKNLAIGSHLNGAANLMFELRWSFAERWVFSTAISFTHFSNGTIKTPNYGLNMPALNGAVAYRLSRKNPYLEEKLLPKLESFEFDGKKSLQLDIAGALAVKDMQAVLGVGNRYLVYTVFANILSPVTYKSKFGIGLDASYDASDVKLIEVQGNEPKGFLKVMKTGITAAYELSFSRMAMMFNVGIYFGGQEKSDGDIYEKLGLRFDITEQLFANLTLKAHFARADFVAIGIGYKFNLIYY
jgi:hypothetical protein